MVRAVWLRRGLYVVIVAAASLAVVQSAMHAATVGPLFAGYVIAALAGEFLLVEARAANRVQFGVALMLFTVAGGDGAAAPAIAVAALLGRWLGWPVESVRWSPAAFILPVAAGAAWGAGLWTPRPYAGLLTGEIANLPRALAAALAFAAINVALVSLITACTDRSAAALRLRQHGTRLLRRYALAGLGAWGAVAVCDLFLNQYGSYLILATFGLAALSITVGRRRRLANRRSLVAVVQAIGAKDPYTGGHVTRVGELALAIAGELGLPEEAIDRIGFAAAMHDLGKVTVPGELLRCDGTLDVGQRAAINEHALSGELLLRGLSGLPEAALVAGSHHERWDGAGYPRGRAGATIPLPARITAVADSWDAMTSDRPYRKALAGAIAWGEIERGSGSQFEPAVVAAFARWRAHGATRNLSLLSRCDTTPLIC